MQQDRAKLETPEFIKDTQRAVNVLSHIAAIGGAPLELFLRKPGTMGIRYLSWRAIVGMAGPLLACEFIPVGNPDAIWWFALMAMVMFLLHVIEGVKLRRRGYKPHSRFDGISGFGTGKRAKSFYEPAAVMVAGGLAFYVSPALGLYLFASAVCLNWNAAMWHEQERGILRDMNDAQVMQAYHRDLMEGERRWGR